MLEKVITLLFISSDPFPVQKLSELLGVSKEEIEGNSQFVKSKLQELGLTLLVAEDGWSIATQPEQASLVEMYRKEELKGDLTPAALQVLTLVAYLGSPTREQISYIRGVQSTQSIRSLTVRGLINRSGEVCTLTTDALKHLGVTTPEELPDYESLHKSLLEKLAEKE